MISKDDLYSKWCDTNIVDFVPQQYSTEHTWMLWWLHVGFCWQRLRQYVFFSINEYDIYGFFKLNNNIDQENIISFRKKLYTSNSGTVFAECSPGFTGVGCSIKCSYPLFGENCLRICSCSPVEFCDFIFGCLKRKSIRVRGCMCRWILASYM